jgi:hypothetical protein
VERGGEASCLVLSLLDLVLVLLRRLDGGSGLLLLRLRFRLLLGLVVAVVVRVVVARFLQEREGKGGRTRSADGR